jgi:ribosomal protein S18 acetylase RimI-like enzyme
MTDQPRETGSVSVKSLSSELLRRDAKILQEAVREAVRTSPNSFLKTLNDVDRKGRDFWIDEIQRSTWAVVERDGEVVGIAAGKRPDPDKDREDPDTTRYIESVWIAPRLRGHRLGERLIRFLLEVEHQRNQRLEQFLLWVFKSNSSAIKLYDHMGFQPTGECNDGIKPEVKFKLKLNLNREVNAAVVLMVNEAARRQDQWRYRLTYRVLGDGNSA